MRTVVPLRRVTSMRYGDALASDARIDGPVPVMSSGGITGSHHVPNTAGPCIVVGRKGSQGSVWWSDVPTFVIDTAYSIDASTTSSDLRWLYYVLSAAGLRSVSNDVGVPGLSREAAYETLVPAPPSPSEQRRIADFLDDQVARIDNLIARRRSQSDLLVAVEHAEIEEVLWGGNVGSVELRRLGTRVTTGPFGTVFVASDYVADGVPMINPTHIVGGRLVPDGHHSVAHDTARRLLRHQLHVGDIVTGRKGDIGRSAVVEPSQDGWICGSDSIAVHADSERMLPSFLDLVLHLPRVRVDLVSRSPGATMPSLNEGMLLSVVVPDIPVGEQRRRVGDGAALRDASMHRRQQLESSSQLLVELKRSLITAAVTGEFDVSSVDGSRVPV